MQLKNVQNVHFILLDVKISQYLRRIFNKNIRITVKKLFLSPCDKVKKKLPMNNHNWCRHKIINIAICHRKIWVILIAVNFFNVICSTKIHDVNTPNGDGDDGDIFNLDPSRYILHGPGFEKPELVFPARYFFVQLVDKQGRKYVIFLLSVNSLPSSSYTNASIYGPPCPGNQGAEKNILCKSKIHASFMKIYKIASSFLKFLLHLH